jgi:galactokinase/mevalonate kinase-like predicted kinase
LGLVTIDVAKDGDTFAISNIDPNPSFTGFGSSSSIASDVITALETRIRTPGRVHDNSDIAS